MAYFLSDYAFAARYPFTSTAKELMKERSIDVNESMAELGFERLKSALRGEIKRKLILHEEDAVEEIIAYAAARMMLSHMRNRFLANRYAVAEAKKAFAYLGSESAENVDRVAKDMGLNSFSLENGKLSVDIADFLTYAPKDVHYGLVSRELGAGRVSVNEHERLRLIEEAIKKYLERVPETQSVPPAIKKFAEKLYALLPKIEPQKISFKEGDNPPCIEAILELLKKHENVGHSGRWLLAVYLINAGVSTQDMLKIFSNAPDYNEKISTYQIEHARKKSYRMPSCSSVAVYGYCVAVCNIGNPMNWARRKSRLPSQLKTRQETETKGAQEKVPGEQNAR
ncbi:MAG: hypothetical protein PHS02_04145 [Candidatus ainarchaeum sp.]|nr:hypothetical protein [Candidatus ainarchaeum sp.]